MIFNAKSAVHEVGYISLGQVVLQTISVCVRARADCDFSTLFSQGVCVCVCTDCDFSTLFSQGVCVCVCLSLSLSLSLSLT